MKKILLGMFLVLLMVPMVLSVGDNVAKDTNGGHLIITDVDVKVDGRSDKDLKDGEEIDRDAKPGSTVEFTFRVANNFTDEDGVEIEDIVLTLEVDFDYDDVDEESKEFDLDPGDDKKIKIEFDVPFEVDDTDFTIFIEVDGSTDGNGSQKVEMELELVVEKEKNGVIFTKNELTPSEIKCGGTVRLVSTVMNLGRDEEEDVMLEFTNTELGVSFSKTFDLSEDPDDDNYDLTQTFTFRVPDDVASGIHAIESKVTFDDGSKTKTETAELFVGECEVLNEEEPEEEEEEEPEVVVVTPTIPTTPIVTEPTVPTETEEKSLFQSGGFITALIVGEILVVVIAVLLVITLMRRKS